MQILLINGGTSMKKIIALILSAVMIFMLTSCGKKNDDSNASGGKDALEIYYLNFKPEIADIYKEIATAYEKETGVKVKVVTAASDSYETTLKSEIATMVTDKLITASVKDFAQDKDYLNAFIVALASKWSVDEPIVISTADAESLKKYFAAHAKALLDKGVKIEQVNGIKTLFTVSPADGSYKVNFGEEEFMNYFKAFLRPQLVEMLF